LEFKSLVSPSKLKNTIQVTVIHQDEYGANQPIIQDMQAPQDPPREVFNPIIDECITHPQLWVLPRNGNNGPVFQQTEVVKRYNATQTYQIIDGIAPRELSHGGPVCGYLYVAAVLPRRADDLLYEEPTAETVQRVVIKKLFKEVVHRELDRGSEEDPYKEIYRMQSIGDDFHVVGCTEALQDEQYLYIISPYCEGESLIEHSPLRPIPNEAHARELFRQMLQDLEYLHEQHAICHRDIDPGNFLVSRGGRVMLNDFAMSIPIPIPLGGLVTPQPRWANRPIGHRKYITKFPGIPNREICGPASSLYSIC
jgi:serine/threonine protein kinase